MHLAYGKKHKLKRHFTSEVWLFLNTFPAFIQKNIIILWGIQKVTKSGAGKCCICSALLFWGSLNSTVTCHVLGILLLKC